MARVLLFCTYHRSAFCLGELMSEGDAHDLLVHHCDQFGDQHVPAVCVVVEGDLIWRELLEAVDSSNLPWVDADWYKEPEPRWRVPPGDAPVFDWHRFDRVSDMMVAAARKVLLPVDGGRRVPVD